MTLLAPDEVLSDGRPGEVSVGRVAWRSDVTVAVAALLLLVAGLAFGSPSLVLLGVVATATAAVHARLPLDLAIPVAVLLLLVGGVTAGVGAGMTGTNLLAHPRLLGGSYVVLAALVLAHRVSRPRRPWLSAPAAPGGWNRLAWAPAGLALATGLLQAASLGVAKSWAFWGTDLARHVNVVGRLQHDASLSYQSWPYPRGLHLLAALSSVSGAPRASGDLMAYDVQLCAALTWFALALMIATSTALAMRAGRALSLAPHASAVAGFVTGAGALTTGSFLLSFVYLGAAPSLVAVCVLQGLPLLLLARPDPTHRLALVTLGCAAATVALAHLWQALVLAPVVAWAVLALPELRGLPGQLRARATRRPLLAAVAAALALGALAVPPVIGVSSSAGLSYAAVPGELAGPPWRILAPGLLVVIVLAVVRRRDGWVRACVAISGGMVLVTGLLLRGTGDVTDLDQYYPQKSAWFLALALSPVLAVGAAAVAFAAGGWLWRYLDRSGRFAFAFRAAMVGLLLPGLAAWLGFLIGVDSPTAAAWQRATPAPAGSTAPTTQLSAVRFDLARDLGREKERVVVPWDLAVATFDPYGTMTISLLLGFETGQPEMRLGGTLCDEVRWTAGSRRALVVSQRPSVEIERELAAGGCRDRADVLQRTSTGYLD